MTEHNKPRKVESGAFVGPRDLVKLQPPEGRTEDPPPGNESENNVKPKWKLLWYIIPSVILIVIFCAVFIPRSPLGNSSQATEKSRAIFTSNRFTVNATSLHLVDRAYFKKDDSSMMREVREKDEPSVLRQVCENIEKYSQAFTVDSEVPLKEIKSKALVAEVTYCQENETKRDLSFAITDPMGKETLSLKQNYLWKTEETIFVNLDSFFDNGISWETGIWNIAMLTNDKVVTTFTILIVE